MQVTHLQHGCNCGFGRRPLPFSRGTLRTTALFTKKGKAAPKKKEAPPPKKQGFLSSFTDAIDFSQVRSESDRALLDAAKRSKGRQKMSQEQYAALRRKVGGTARDYWKDYIEADEAKGYVSTDGPQITGLPFLLAVVVGLGAALAVVLSQTQQPAQTQPSATVAATSQTEEVL